MHGSTHAETSYFSDEVLDDILRAVYARRVCRDRVFNLKSDAENTHTVRRTVRPSNQFNL